MDNEETGERTELTGKFSAAQGGARRVDAEQMLASIDANLFGRQAAEVQLGRFKVLERIGAGGMGVVLKAYDPQLDRIIAIKILKSAAGESAARELLLDEARSMAKVRHPSLVTVFEAGLEDGEVFVAMEFVDGFTLRQWWSDHGNTWNDVLATIVPAAEGLAAIHAAGLVHRDFKPDNVLIDREGRAQVTDFGLARSLSPSAVEAAEVGCSIESSTSDAISENGQTVDSTLFAGSPGYLAPEQWRGGPATALSDQFSLCITLYEALYGERPFPDSSIAVLADSVIEGTRRPKPTPRVASVPGWLDKIVERGLSTHPADRFSSITALLQAVERGRRRRVVLLVGGAVAASLVATAAAFGLDDTPSLCEDTAAPIEAVWSKTRAKSLEAAFSEATDPLAPQTWKRIQPELEAYATQLSDRRREACEATRVRGEASEDALDIRMRCLDRRIDGLAGLLAVLETAEPKVVLGAVAATEDLAPVSSCDDIDTAATDRQRPDDPKLAERVDTFHRSAGELAAMANAGRWAEGAEVAELLLKEAEEIGFAPTIAEATYYRGMFAAKSGDIEGAQRRYQKAFEIALATGVDELIAWAAIQQIDINGNLRADPEKAEFWANIGRAAIQRRGSESMLEAALDNNLGTAALRGGDGQKASVHFLHAIEIYDRVGRGASVRAGEAHNNLAVSYTRQGKHDEALAELALSRKILTNALGAEHPSLGGVHNALGGVYLDTLQLDKAEAAFTDSLKLKQARLPPAHPSLGYAYNNLGEVAAMRGRHEAAIDLFTKALEVWEPALGKTHPLVAHTLTERGFSLLALPDKSSEAAADLERAVAALAETPEVPPRARARFGLARATSAPEAARALAEAALAELAPGHEARAEIESWLKAQR